MSLPDLEGDEERGIKVRMKGGRADRGTTPTAAMQKVKSISRRLKKASGVATGRGAAVKPSAQSGGDQRVTVQANITKNGAKGARGLEKHAAYLQRDGAGRDGEAAEFFDAETDGVDGKERVQEWAEDRHHFRMMISPENGDRLKDLPEYTREVMAQAERDLGVKLDWVAVEHQNTGHPHVHVIVRGKEPDGRDLVIARRYMSHGFRARASQQATIELGPRTVQERRAALDKEITAERMTSLDRALAKRQGEGVLIDARQLRSGARPTDFERAMAGRVRHLERIGLAEKITENQFKMATDWQRQLRERGEQNDIVRTMQKGGVPAKEVRPYRAQDGEFAGRVIQKGIANELKDTPYIVVSDGRGQQRHLTIARNFTADEIRPGAIVVVGKPIGTVKDADALTAENARVKRGLAQVRIISAEPVEKQITAHRATELDAQLARVQHAPWHEARGGEPMIDAMDRRADFLARQGYATREKDGRFAFKDGALDKLRAEERTHIAKEISARTGQPHKELPNAEAEGRVSAIRRTSTGRTLVIERQGGFSLANSPKGQPIRTGDQVSVRPGARGRPSVSKIERER